MLDQTTAPGLDERYTTAITASNLKVEGDRTGAADLLIAMGWNKSRTGAALLRLRTEYDAHARAPGEDNATAMRLLCGNLRSLGDVLREVEGWATRARMDRPRALTLAVVAWWVDRVCKVCQGRQKESIPDTPSLSGQHCKCCHGTGTKLTPYGDAGKWVADYMTDCTNAAASSMHARMYARR